MPDKEASVIILCKYRRLYLGQPGNWRVRRGGSFVNNDNNARASNRNNNHPNNRNNNNGFRVVCGASFHNLSLSSRRVFPCCGRFPDRATPVPLPIGSRTLWLGQPVAGAGSGVCPTIGSRFQFMLTGYGL